MKFAEFELANMAVLFMAMIPFFAGCLTSASEISGMAPDFTASATGGKTVTLASLRGQWVILYFYPKADTPGCTKEACSLRDGFADITKAGAVILGVSLDGVDALEKFKEKYHLPFELLSDSDKKLSKAYGVLAPGGLFALRRTFIINPEGRIVHLFKEVDVAAHSAEVLAVIHPKAP